MSESKDDGWIKQEGLMFWKPGEKGETLIGVVVEVVEGDYGNRYLVRTKDDMEFLTPSHKVLQNRMAKTTEGSVVKIVFLGTSSIAAPGKNPAKMYDVFIKKS